MNEATSRLAAREFKSPVTDTGLKPFPFPCVFNFKESIMLQQFDLAKATQSFTSVYAAVAPDSRAAVYAQVAPVSHAAVYAQVAPLISPGIG